MIIIEADSKNSRYFKDLWDYKDLIYFLSWKDILVRYKQTAIGLVWTVIRPLLVMIALSLVFGRLANMAAGQSVPYPLLVLSGLIPWLLFANTLAECSESIVSNANLVTKIFFPRLIIPISSTIVSLVDMLVTLGLLGFVLLWYGYPVSMNVLVLPFFIVLCLMLSFGVGLWVAAFNVRYRDFRYVIPFALQFGLYATPVGFSSSVVTAKSSFTLPLLSWLGLDYQFLVDWRIWYGLNPLVGIIDGFRWCILGSTQPIFLPTLSLSIIISTIILASGLCYFRRVEKTFADII